MTCSAYYAVEVDDHWAVIDPSNGLVVMVRDIPMAGLSEAAAKSLVNMMNLTPISITTLH
jgi:hypothetical protein